MDTTKLVIFPGFCRRGKGYWGWIVTGLLVGPLLVGLFYLCTAHRSPNLPGHENNPIF
jgi:hypothetical protein